MLEFVYAGVVVILVSIVMFGMSKMFKNEKFKRIHRIVLEAVQSVEQMSKAGELPDKERKQTAINESKRLMTLAGIKPPSDDIIGFMVEGAVFVVNWVQSRGKSEEASALSE